MPRSSRRKSTPVSPAKSRRDATPPQQTKRTSRTRSHEPSATAPVNKRRDNKTLGPVEEEVDAASVHGLRSTRGQASTREVSTREEDGQHSGVSRRVPSIRASVYSDITPTEIRLEKTIKHLTELNFRADELLSQLDLYSATQLLDHLSNRQSVAWSDFSEDAERLERERQHYCGDEDFLQIDQLLEELAAKNLPTMGAGHIYMKANLALFFYRLVEAHPVELHNLLITLSSIQAFPDIFTSVVAPGTEVSANYNETFQTQTSSLGVEILTQCFIYRTKRSAHGPKFNYAKTLQDVFFVEKGVFRNLSLGQSSTQEQEVYIKSAEIAASEIMRVISKKNSVSSNLAILEERYPWAEFAQQALAWVKIRFERISHNIQHAGGVQAIKHSLQQSSVQPDPTAMRRKPRTSKADEEFAGKVTFLKNVDETLNAGEADSQQEEEVDNAQPDANDAEPGLQNELPEEVEIPARSNRILREIAPDTIPESPQAHDRQRNASQMQEEDQSNLINNDEQIEEEIPDSAQSPSTASVLKPTPATTAILQVLQRQTKEGNKENSPPAQPVATSNRQTAAPSANSAVPTHKQTQDKGKRRREDDDINEDSEDDFESDRRHTKHPRPNAGRNVAPTRNNQPTTSNAFIADTVESTIQIDNPAHTTRLPPPSTQPNPRTNQANSPTPSHAHSNRAPPPSSYQAYENAKRHARPNTTFAASLTTTHPKPPQTRRPWTVPEIERLLYLMRQYGCAWSTIKKADERMVDPQLVERSQVQLKDKARNMKLDFLKAEVELPVELAGVTISRVHKEMLKGMNIAFPGEDDEEEER